MNMMFRITPKMDSRNRKICTLINNWEFFKIFNEAYFLFRLNRIFLMKSFNGLFVYMKSKKHNFLYHARKHWKIWILDPPLPLPPILAGRHWLYGQQMPEIRSEALKTEIKSKHLQKRVKILNLKSPFSIQNTFFDNFQTENSLLTL